MTCSLIFARIYNTKELINGTKPLTKSVVGCGGGGPIPYMSTNNVGGYQIIPPPKATDEVGGSLLM
jgi:hypothetical protein